MYKLASIIVLSVAMIGVASAGTIECPEIDPASASSGLALLMGGLAVLRGRFKKQ